MVDSKPSPASRGGWRWLVPLLASSLGLCTLKLLDPHLVSRSTLLAWLQPLGAWTPLAYVGLLAVRPLTLLPGQVLTALGGVLFGGLEGALYAVVGSALASTLTFFIGRRFGTRLVRRALGDKTEALARAARENDFLFALVFTLNPLVPTDPILALAAGAGASYKRTLAGTLLGIVPGTLATAYFGTALAAGHPWIIAISIAGWALAAGGGVFVGLRLYRSVFSTEAATPKPRRARVHPVLRPAMR